DLAILQEHDISLHKVRFWWLAIAVIPLIMLIAATGVVDILQAALIGTVILLLVGAITPQEAYQSVNWSVIVMIAAFIPVGIAMERSGAAHILGSSITTFGNMFDSDMAPRAAMSSLFFVAAVITSIMSNNTAAIVLVPVAFSVAGQMGVDVRPFIFAVAFGASTSFITPIGYTTNLMVYGPGQYRFSDFIKVGTPLNILFWILATFLIPVFWPF
ncbi:MAG TPA: SLC13 family permease, partial [Candidatus Marinimicrobia bacterium]|nr:SLC13 family permease [Candidatus Neomarinimicrobiota bacterium]